MTLFLLQNTDDIFKECCGPNILVPNWLNSMETNPLTHFWKYLFCATEESHIQVLNRQKGE